MASRLRRLWLSSYPQVVFYWLVLANRVLALDVSAVDKEGTAPPDGALVESYQGVELAIHDQVASFHGAYTFKSSHDVPLELTCNFRLGQSEGVDAFSYWNGSEQVVGEVLEKQTATQVYEQLAGVEHRDPGILEQDGEQFRFRVFPVAPGEDKLVELRTVAKLAMHDGFIEYRIPKENLPTGKDAIFSFSARITDDLPIEDVQTVGWSGKVVRKSAREVHVVYEAEGVTPAQDLAIRYRLAADDYALRLVTHREGDGDGTFMLIVSPKAAIGASDVIGRDIVFVTDVSGSMDGTPLEQSKQGLRAILGQLSPRDRFEVISFESQSHPMFGHLIDASAENRARAQQQVSELHTLGGTNIRAALIDALETLKVETSGRPRAIVFLTDGQGEEPAAVVLDEVQKRTSSVRIYSFGVGDGVNRSFLQRLSADNRGSATFVQSETQIGAAMQALYARISMPLMLGLSLDWGGMAITSMYPKRLPDLYRDGEVVVLGRYKPGHGRIKVRGELREGAKELALDATLPELESEHAYVEKLWASERIDSLLADIDLRGEDPELVQEVTRLGIVYNVVTRYTTFLAVPASVQTAELKAQIRDGKLGYDKKLIDTLQGIELSQAAIPPGDPVLTVDAPADAREVTAYFPFGLVKQLAYDTQRGRWYVRFLVPRDVADGHYTIAVKLVLPSGKIEWRDIDYVIDGSAPELNVVMQQAAFAGELMHIAVDPLEPVSKLYVTLPGVSKARIPLHLHLETGLYEGEIRVPDRLQDGDELTVRVVAVDRAKNRTETDTKISIYFDDGGC